MIDVSQPTVATTDGDPFPVRRIFCIGKNYADHTREMGGDPRTSLPVFFTKPADAASNDGTIPFPQATDNLHYEGELVAALKGGGKNISASDAGKLIYGYACGCDLTRRDLQLEAKEKGNPWDLAKALDNGAMMGPITPRTAVMGEGPIKLSVNGEERQSADLDDMIWSVAEIIAKLSTYFELKAGDLVFTGTPAGVGKLLPGDKVEVAIADLAPLRFSLAP